jgi:hypothetical protein
LSKIFVKKDSPIKSRERKPELPLQKVIMGYLSGIAPTMRDFEEKTGITKDMLKNYTEMYNYMGLDKMAKILDAFPETRSLVIDYLGGNTEEIQEKHTDAPKTDEAGVRELLRQMREEIVFLRARNTDLTTSVLNLSRGEVVKQG